MPACPACRRHKVELPQGWMRRTALPLPFSRFLHSLSCLLEVPTDRLEPPTVGGPCCEGAAQPAFGLAVGRRGWERQRCSGGGGAGGSGAQGRLRALRSHACTCAAAQPRTLPLVSTVPYRVLQVTWYRRGQYQRIHFDAPAAGRPRRPGRVPCGGWAAPGAMRGLPQLARARPGRRHALFPPAARGPHRAGARCLAGLAAAAGCQPPDASRICPPNSHHHGLACTAPPPHVSRLSSLPAAARGRTPCSSSRRLPTGALMNAWRTPGSP